MLTTRIFPIAEIKPLYKNTDSSNFNNYKPISPLPVISKIFEKIFHSQILKYFMSNNLVSENQFGFQLKHSTEHASSKLYDYLLPQLNL